MSSDRTYNTEISADPTGFIAAFRRAQEAASQSSEQIKRSTEGISSGFEFLHGKIAALGSLLAGGVFGEFVKSNVELQDQLFKSAQKAGITTEAFSATAYAAKLADISTEQLGKGYAKLDVVLANAKQGQEQAVDLFRRLKLDPQNMQDADELLTALAERFGSMEDGALKTSLAVDIFGRKIGPDLIPLLNQGRDGLEELRLQAAELGVVVSTAAGARAEKFGDTMKELGAAVRGASMQISDQLIPTLQALADVALQSKSAISDVGIVVRTVFETVAVLAANVSFVLKGMGRELAAIAAQVGLVVQTLNSLSSGDFIATARRNWAGYNAISEAVKADGVKARAELDALEKRILGTEGGGAGRGSINPAVVRPGGGFEPLSKTPTSATTVASSELPQLELDLAQRKAAIERAGLAEDQFREMSKAAELAYWRDVLATHTLSEQDKLAVTRKVAEGEMAAIKQTFDMRVKTLQTEAEQYKSNTDERLRIETQIQAKYAQGTAQYEESAKRIAAIQKQAADQARAVAQSRVDAESQARLQIVALEEQTARQAEQLGQITHAQLLALQEVYEQRRYSIADAGLRERLQLAQLDPDRNPVEAERINRELEQLEQQHQLRLGALRGQMTLESQASAKQMAGSLESSFASVFASIGTGIKSIGGLMRGLAQALLQTFIQLAAQIAAKWLVQRLLMRTINKAAALSDVLSESAKAGAGGTASMAAAPFPINLGAPAFGAAMAALAASFAPLASAAGGFDIPGTVNPIVQTHAREMVLPAKYADVIRGLSDGQGAQASAPIVLPEIRALPFGDVLAVHRGDFVKFLTALQRDNAWRPGR